MARVVGAAVFLLAMGAGLTSACGTNATTVTSGPAPVTPTAQGAPSTCVTHQEFQEIRKGMRRAQVERSFRDTRSRLAAGGAGGYVRSYKACDGQHQALVEYEVIWHDRTVVGARFNGFKRWILAG
jgi:hypothetical protein